MFDLTKLRLEHGRLIEIAGELLAVVTAPQAPATTKLFGLRKNLTSVLIAHLKAEDWVIYPSLLASPHPSVKQAAHVFSKEMGSLAQAYGTYTHKWNASSIEADWVGYCKETRVIIASLIQRIERENRDLYPLLETAANAADVR